VHDNKCKVEHSHTTGSIFRKCAESPSNFWVEFLVIWMQLRGTLWPE